MTVSNKKWGLSYERWPWSNYPDYLAGIAMMISGKAILPLLAATQVTPFFHIDDVWTTGIIASKAGVPVWMNERYIMIYIVFKKDIYSLLINKNLM